MQASVESQLGSSPRNPTGQFQVGSQFMSSVRTFMISPPQIRKLKIWNLERLMDDTGVCRVKSEGFVAFYGISFRKHLTPFSIYSWHINRSCFSCFSFCISILHRIHIFNLQTVRRSHHGVPSRTLQALLLTGHVVLLGDQNNLSSHELNQAASSV